MSAMHLLRCSQGARVATGRAKLIVPRYARLQSTEVAPVPPLETVLSKEPSTTTIVPKPVAKKKTLPQLNQVLSKEDESNSSKVRSDLKKLDGELDALYEQRRKLASMLNGPTRVRTQYGSAQPETINAHITFANNKVSLDGKVFPNIWLRDNCQCSNCMHESTKQRLQDTFAIPRDLSIKAASCTKDMEASKTQISIEWSDGHKSTYAQPFLANAVANLDSRAVTRQGLAPTELWASEISRHKPMVSYSEAVRDNMGPVLRQLRKYGFCYINDTPHDTPQATEDLLRRIAFIRETHYGGFYDFTADLASQDTAYTNIALEAHTDNTYFSDPAGLQAFHLLSHTDGSGGASLLVDGFKVADELLQTDRQAYRVLSETNVHAHASGNEGISIQPYRGFPVLEHDAATGDLLRVRWNSSDRASIELPIEEVETWYDAARKFDALLKKKENEYWEQLVPGRVLVFDNWRVLHGRSAFTGKRRICGGMSIGTIG